MPDMPGQAFRCLVNISCEQGQQDLLVVVQSDLHAPGVEGVLRLKHTNLAAQHREAVDQASIARSARDERVKTDVYLIDNIIVASL